MKRLFLFNMLLLSMGSAAYSQAIPLDSIKAKLYRVNAFFDSAYFMQFDVRYVYSTDTLFGKADYHEMTGNYLLKGKGFYYKLGSVEYMQNDSFAFHLFHDDKTVLLAKRQFTGASSTLPLRNMIDSIISNYQESYIINFSEDSVEGEEIYDFSTRDEGGQDTLLPYSGFTIAYNRETSQLSRMEVRYAEYESTEGTENVQMGESILRRKKMKMYFSNYKMAATDFGIFKEENYVYFDYIRKKYFPVEKYRGYRLYANGVEETDYDVESNPVVNQNN